MTIAPPRAGKSRHKTWQQSGPLIWFVVLAYLFAWAWSIPVAIVGGVVEQGSGWPTHVPSLVAPLLAALTVVGLTEGRAGLSDLVKRIGRWRIGPVWWLVAASPLVILGLTLTGMALAGQGILSTYSGFTTMTLFIFPLGLASGAVVLTWLYNRSGRSVLAVALWHTLYNMAVATGGANDLIQGVVTAVVMVAAVILVIADVIARRRSRGPVLELAR